MFLHKHTHLFFSTKAKVLNYIKKFYSVCSNTFFCDWCFHCEAPLKRDEKTLCSVCIHYVHIEVGDAETICAPQGSLLEEILKKKMPPSKFQKLMEAVLLKALLEATLSDEVILISEEGALDAYRILKRNFPVTDSLERVCLKNKEVVAIGFNRSPSYERSKIYCQLSNVKSFKAIFVFEGK